MAEIERIVRMFRQTFEGKPYYGPSVLGALEDVTAALAVRKPIRGAHSIWEIVLHLTAELAYALEVVQGIAGPYGDTWPATSGTGEPAWEKAVAELKRANRALLQAIQELDDSALERQPVRVRGPFYTMIHGTMQHNIYHAGQIAVLKRRGQE
jgi:uncharacterized damage-inducible protein DinB